MQPSDATKPCVLCTESIGTKSSVRSTPLCGLRQQPKAAPGRGGAALAPGIAAHALRLALRCLIRCPAAGQAGPDGAQGSVVGDAAARLVQGALALHALSLRVRSPASMQGLSCMWGALAGDLAGAAGAACPDFQAWQG